MAASVKHQWHLAKYAKFVYSDEENNLEEENIAEKLDVSCKGKWKVYTGKDKDLNLSYLESNHFLIIHKDMILESFSLMNSSTWLKGVARRDSLLILHKLKDGNNRRFRIQFDNSDEESDGFTNRKECTDILKAFFPVCDYDSHNSNTLHSDEIANIDKMVLNKLQIRKGYAIDIPKENLKEIVMLCLTDTTFPSYVAEIDNIIKNIGK